MKDPMKSISFVPKTIPGVGCVRQGLGEVCHVGWGVSCRGGVGWGVMQGLGGMGHVGVCDVGVLVGVVWGKWGK